MTYALHAHDLDPGRVTGIARYARGLGEALQPLLRSDERATLVTARDCGAPSTDHVVIPVTRKYLYASWLTLRTPRWEWLVPQTDLLHATAPIVPTPTRKPLVVTVHDLTPMTHPEWYSPTAVSWFNKSMAWTKARADAVLTPTQFVADQVYELLGLDESRITVTGEGFDLAHFAASDPDGALRSLGLRDVPYVLYLGTLSARKNLVPLIQALPESGPVLVLAGPDSLGSDEVKAAAALRPGRVRVVGRLTDDQIGPLVQRAVALVHPSSFEGFGLTVLEAMGVGTPVIVSDGGALPEVVGNGGHVVPSNDRQGWSEALLVLDDPVSLAALRQAGLARAKHWSWETAAERTLAVYRRVAS